MPNRTTAGQPAILKILRANAWVILFFGLFLALGIVLYRDYGISWDEKTQRGIGQMNFDYLMGRSDSLLASGERYHGGSFELGLVVIEKLIRARATRDIFMARHLVNFLFFWTGAVLFYALLKNQFKSWKVALLGCLFLVLSPRIFADAFYNSKDIPFLVVFLAGILTLIRYLDHPSPARAAVHGFVCAAAVAIRIPGVFLPAFTVGFLLLDRWLNPEKKVVSQELLTLGLIVYGLALSALTVLFFPGIWENPILHGIRAYLEMSHYSAWDQQVLYMGRFIDADVLPWHYLPVWILITTPLYYVLLFAIGLAQSIFLLTRPPIYQITREKRNQLIFLGAFFVPLFSVILGKSIVYDGWRHLYFVYPSLVIIATQGLVSLWRFFSAKFPVKWATAGFVLVSLVALSGVIRFMLSSHPYQNVYFNTLAGASLADIKPRYELDYWGLSYRKGLEYILKTDPRAEVRVYPANGAVKDSALILEETDRKRIVLVDAEQEADYFIGNYRYHPDEYPYPNPVYSVRVQDAALMTVFKLK